MTITTVVFDAYGTLFDVAGAARLAAQEPACAAIADDWAALAAEWRDKQLDYTWLRAATGYHSDFRLVTRDALDYVLEARGLSDPALADRLMALYDELPAYPEVVAALAALRDRGLTLAILSNGTPQMLDAAVRAAGLEGWFAAVLSVQSVDIYKPAPAVYDLVEDKLGTAPGETLFVSSNGWDAFSASAYGFVSVWVNRANAPDERLPSPPAARLRDLEGLPALVDEGFPAPVIGRTPAQFFEASDGLRLAYRDEGTGPVVLCLAGLTRNMADFDFVARDFSGRARILRLDTRGRGESAHDPDYMNYNLIREGRDALDLLDHLGLQKAGIVGTSRGGLIALSLAMGHHDRLSGACLVDIGPEISPEGIAFIFSYLGVTPDYATYEEAADALVAATAERFPGVPRARWRLHAERIWKETASGLVLRYDAKLRNAVMEQSATGAIQDLWPLFDALEGLPVALIRGENSDILSREVAKAMRDRRPDMIFAEVPRRGHVPFLDERGSRRALAAFIDRLE